MKIKEIFSGVKGDKLTLTFPDCRGVYPLEIKNFLVKSDNGKQLKFSYLRKPEIGTLVRRVYTIETQGEDKIVVEYNIKPYLFDEIFGDHAFVAYFNEDMLITLCGYIFLIPILRLNSNDISVYFDIPKDWRVIVPFPKINGMYKPKSLEYFFTSSLALGLFEEEKKMIKGTLFDVAFYSKFDNVTKKQIVYYNNLLFGYLRDLWGEDVEFHQIIYPPDVEGGETIGHILEGSQNQVHSWIPNSPLLGYYNFYGILHRGNHIWNLFAPTGMAFKSYDEMWFEEDTNNYYTFDKSLFTLHILTNHSILKGIHDYYINEVYNTKYDVPIAYAWKYKDPNDPEFYRMMGFIQYGKGALISFLLDQKIKEVTKGEKSLDDLLKILYKKYGHFMNPKVENYWYNPNVSDKQLVSTDIIKYLLEDLTSYDFTTFLINIYMEMKNYPLKNIL